MSENRGIFSLEEFFDLQVSGETTNIFEVFRYVNSLPSTVSNYGYWAGGMCQEVQVSPVMYSEWILIVIQHQH